MATERMGDGGPAEVVATTRTLPNGNEGFANQCEPREFSGYDIGPFFVHEDVSDDGVLSLANSLLDSGWWHVTHNASGRAVQKRIPSKERAIWLAKKLLDFDVWTGNSRDEVLANIPAEIVTKIKVLRMDAKYGDCQGEFA